MKLKTLLRYCTATVLMAQSLQGSAQGHSVLPKRKSHISYLKHAGAAQSNEIIISSVRFHDVDDPDKTSFTADLSIEDLPDSHGMADPHPAVRILHIMVENVDELVQAKAMISFAHYLWHGYKGERSFYKAISLALSDNYHGHHPGQPSGVYGQLPEFSGDLKRYAFRDQLEKTARAVAKTIQSTVPHPSPCCSLIIAKKRVLNRLLDISGGIVAHY